LLQTNRFVLLLGLIVSTFTYGAEDTPLDWDPKVIRGQLPNGLNYYLYDSDNETEPFNVRLIVHAGSVDEEQSKGIAHAVEHMVFNQTAAHPESIHHYLKDIGWRTGKQINAVTRQTETQYMVRTRPDDSLNLRQSLDLLADMVSQATFNQKDWDKERQIIIEEWRLGNSVADRINQKVKQATKANSRYTRGAIIGSKASIESMTLADLKTFYQNYYIASNMSLVVVGNLDIKQSETAIKAAFAQLENRPAPDRSYVEFPLDNKLTLHKVQDPKGSSYKVALGYRHVVPIKSTINGTKIRLENYLLRKLLLQQIKRDRVFLPEGIERLTGTLKEVSNQRLVLAFAIRTEQHDKGLTAIVNEIERLRQFGFHQQDFDALLEKAKAISERNISAAEGRIFAKWEDKITEAVLTDSILIEPAEKNAFNQRFLAEITLAQINARLRELLSTADQFVYYQAPGSVQLNLPSEDQVAKIFQQASRKKHHQPVEKTTVTVKAAANKTKKAIVLPGPLHQGDVENYHHFPTESVHEWQLANGNKVVLLEKETPNDRVYIKSITNAGSMTEEIQSWLADAAIQLKQQNGQNNLTELQWNEWKEQNDINWKLALSKYHLDISILVDKPKLESALQAYWNIHQSTEFTKEALTEAVSSATQLLERLKQIPEQEQTEVMRYNRIVNTLTSDNIATQTTQSLNQVTDKLVNQSKTLFIVANISAEQLQPMIQRYVASLNNSEALTPRYPQQQIGKHDFERHREGASATIVEWYGETPLKWRPETSFYLSTLNPIIQQALKSKLRLDLAGVYRIESELSTRPDSDSAAYYLKFTTSPERADELSLAAAKVLADLPKHIKNADLTRIKEEISLAEQSRLSSPNTWLRRLMLSYRAYDDPRYLTSMHSLTKKITAQNLTQLAMQVYPLASEIRIDTKKQPSGFKLKN